jgi:hypothetical protein
VTNDKRYPTDPRGRLDAGASLTAPKPCAKRITHECAADPALRTCITWCALPDGHDGQCSGPAPRVIEPNDFGPATAKRRRW